MAKAKARTIGAWAVVCKTGKVHRRDHQATRFYLDEAVAIERKRGLDHPAYVGVCGPHTVVALTGQWPGPEKGKKGKGR